LFVDYLSFSRTRALKLSIFSIQCCFEIVAEKLSNLLWRRLYGFGEDESPAKAECFVVFRDNQEWIINGSI
jgi:hypothetical protein